MDFENKNITPDGQEPTPQTDRAFGPTESQSYAQPVENPQEEAIQTPYQAQVRGSNEPPRFSAQNDAPVYHDEAHQAETVKPPFEPGTHSYTTFQQWQAQEARKHGKHAKKPRSKKPLLVLGGIAAAVALFVGGMAVGGGFGHTAGSPAASSVPKDENLPVLNISSTPSGDSSSASSTGELAGEDIYKKLNHSIVAIQTADESGQVVSSGSGVVMSSDGYIITNAHVILDEDTSQPMSGVSVLFADGTQLSATVKGYDSQTDLAVIKVEPQAALIPAEFGDSDALQVGETAYAIGSPGGVELANSMTSGIISAINRDITVNDRVMTLIQTNVTINPGNSGGALINKYGQVVGITSAKLGISYYEGLGFAIPINSAKEIIDELIQTGYVSGRPSIGISGRNVSEQMSRFYSLPEGVQIVSIDSRAKAASEGLEAGDVITAVNGQSITTMDEINKIKEDRKAGDTLTLTIYRPTTQKSQDIKITLTDTHDLEGTDPAQEQQQSSSNNYSNRNSGVIDPFQYFFGY
ncbi:MAG: S1C family serine protease [Butyricicoccus sp.]